MLQLDDIRDAARLLGNASHVTPMFRSRRLDEAVGARMLLKMESFQRSGAFKFRGAFTAISRSLERARRSGVVTASSGNHGGAVALAAQTLGVDAVVVVPEDAVAVKRAAIEAAGARVETRGLSSAERLAYAEELVDREGRLFIPPYDHPDTMAGQGTVGLEILEQVPDVDLVLVPCGGGGLLAGVSAAIRQQVPEVEVRGVEPATGDDWVRSFAAGEPITIPYPDTLADGARNVRPGTLTFPIVRHFVERFHTVEDGVLCCAVEFLLTRMKVVVEPTGALGVAAAMDPALDLRGKTVVAVVSGGNVDPATLAACCDRRAGAQ